MHVHEELPVPSLERCGPSRWRLQIQTDRLPGCGSHPNTAPANSHLLGRLLPGLHRQDKHMQIWNSNEFTSNENIQLKKQLDVHAATEWKRS